VNLHLAAMGRFHTKVTLALVFPIEWLRHHAKINEEVELQIISGATFAL
jgi:hypothetical protein